MIAGTSETTSKPGFDQWGRYPNQGVARRVSPTDLAERAKKAVDPFLFLAAAPPQEIGMT
jgi:hypothetical protein